MMFSPATLNNEDTDFQSLMYKFSVYNHFAAIHPLLSDPPPLHLFTLKPAHQSQASFRSPPLHSEARAV